MFSLNFLTFISKMWLYYTDDLKQFFLLTLRAEQFLGAPQVITDHIPKRKERVNLRIGKSLLTSMGRPPTDWGHE